MPQRLRFSDVKDIFRMVVDNGVSIDDPRTMLRTNEATEIIMKTIHPETKEPIIPVNTMMIVEVPVINGYFTLPPEMESAIHVEVIETDPGLVNGESDVRQGFYNIVNPFTYVDPSLSYDNPFTDIFLRPDNDPTKLVRQYFYGGSFPAFNNGLLRVVGPKTYMPLTNEQDFLLVQNIPALKTLIIGIEYRENNQGDEWRKYKLDAIQMIVDEIKKFQSDPRWVMKRKADYELDLINFAVGSMGWMRARLALTVPGALMMGKEDLSRLIDTAQLRMMEAGTFRGCIEEFNMKVTDGHLYFPTRVESVLGASIDGQPWDIRSTFFKFLESGPGACGCGGRLEDEGDRFFPKSGKRRRVYRAHIGTEGSTLVCACKLRWEPKKADEQLVIRNFEANRVMATAILEEQRGQDAGAMLQTVLGPQGILQMELREYLKGIKPVFSQASCVSVGDLGVPL